MKRIIAAMLIITLLAGCEDISSGDDTGGLGSNYRTGTKALVMSFLPNSPPSKLFDTDQILIGLEIRNKGAATVNGGKIYLSGFDRNIVTGLTNSISVNQLEGKTFYNPDGGYQVESLTGGINSQNTPDSYKPIIMATACYSYETEATSDICIDPDPYATEIKEKACSPSDISLSGGQGGPIEVTKIDVDPTKNEMRLTFHIRNAGGGFVYNKLKLSQCSPFSPKGIPLEDKNVINVDHIKVGNQALTGCKPNGNTLKLIDGNAVIMCSYTYPTQQGAFKTPVSIKLSYGYRTSTTRQIEILKTP